MACERQAGPAAGKVLCPFRAGAAYPPEADGGHTPVVSTPSA